MPYDSREEFEALFQKMSTLPSCTSAGPILKLARWCSIQECWSFFRSEVWGLKVVLEHMHGSAVSAITTGTESTSLVLHQQVQAAQEQPGGTIAKALGYITQSLLCDMDVFCLATSVLKDDYSHRASQVKDPNVGSAHNIDCLAGGWEEEFNAIGPKVFYGCVALGELGAWDGSDRGSQNIGVLVDYTFAVMKERLFRVMPAVSQYPQLAALANHRDLELRRAHRRRMLLEFGALLQTEAVERSGHSGAAWVLQAVSRRKYVAIRLFFHVLEK